MTDTNGSNSPAKPKPWERQPGETIKAWAAFCVYRDLGPERTLAKAAAARGLAQKGSVAEWSSKWNWRERAAAWDAEIDRRYLDEMTRRRIDLRSRQTTAAQAFQGKALSRLRDIDPAVLDPTDVARWYELGMKAERLALGEPIDLAATIRHVPIDLAQRMVNGIVEIAFRYLDEAQREPFVAEVSALGRRLSGMEGGQR